MAWHNSYVLWPVLVALVLADVVSTTMNLQAGYVELNPVMQAVAPMPHLHLLVKVLFLCVVGGLSYVSGRIGYSHAPVMAAIGMFSVPVTWNIVVTLF
jgi:hypothetical protein